MFCECKTCTHSELWTKKLQIEPAERKEFVSYTAKGSICCVIEAHGLLPSLIKYFRVVHPKSVALLTHHSSLAADEVDRCSSTWEPLFQPCTVPQRAEAADKAAPCDSPRCSASWCFLFYLYLFWSCCVLAKVDRQPHDEAVGLIHFPLSF